MVKKILINLGSFLLKAIILAVVIYILFSISRSIWKNWKIGQEIKKTEESITQLEEKNKNLENQILYYQTEAFKELEARRRLGLKKPEENVVLVPENTDSDKEQKKSVDKKTSDKKEENLANPLKWWKYILGK